MHGWGRLILKKSRKTKEAASGVVIASPFDPLQVNPTGIGGNFKIIITRVLSAWKDDILDLPPLNTGLTLEYEFMWAKRYSPKAKTFAGVIQSLHRVFRLSINLGPKIWSLVPVNPKISVESAPVESPGRYYGYRTTIRLGEK